MRVVCSTCGGKGRIPDPLCRDMVMGYYGPNGERCPQVFCQTCSGSGWVDIKQDKGMCE